MDKKRTPIQNNSLHRYCELVATALNDAGLNIEEVLQHFTMELDWDKNTVKDIIWRTAQKRMLRKISTTELNKHEDITRVWEACNRFLAKLGVESIPFPHDPENKLH